MSEKSQGQKILENLSYSKKNIFETASAEKVKAIFEYSKGYVEYLDKSKTEREACTEAIKLLAARGYTEYKLGDKIAQGIFIKYQTTEDDNVTTKRQGGFGSTGN